jgi:NAD-dependent DNA ligase
MPSEKVTRILRKRGVAEETMAAMSEEEGWAHIYATAPPKRDKGQDVCFTGFSDAEKVDLVGLAKAAGFNVVTKVTVACFMLCVGATAGAKKVEAAVSQGVRVVTREQLEALIDAGDVC